MLRMVQSQSAFQAKRYFSDALIKADYYLEDKQCNGQIHGRIANRLGVAELAAKDIFFALCENLHPFTGETLTRRNVANRTVGYDINFHCPKSVSIVHVLAGDNHIAQAFQEAVNETMQNIERDAATRVRRNGSDENRHTGEFVWVDFLHQTARPLKDQPPDPHLHSHCFVFNVTWDETEQCFKAAQFRHIKRDMPYYQAKFHARLADRLMALGYKIKRTKTAFEIENVPQAAIDLFSKRSNEIGRLAKELNIQDAKELDELGAKTRQKKQKGLTLTALKKDWRKQIAKLGLTNNDIICRPGFLQGDSATAQECIDFAIAHCFERQSVIQDRRLLAAAYRYGVGKNIGGSIEVAFKNDANIIHDLRQDMRFCTTHDILKEEQKLILLARRGKGQIKPLYAFVPVINSSGEQHTAIAHLLTTSNRVSIIEGRAGTGKTTLMKEAVRLIEQSSRKAIIVAPTSEASRGVLHSEGFANAETIAALLASPELQQSLQNNILWVDEAGMTSTKDMIALLELAEKYNAQVILGGDTKQHSAVSRGDALRLLADHADVHVCGVNRIFRQKKEDYKQAVTFLAEGQIDKGFIKLDDMQAIKEVNAQNPYTTVIDDYLAVLAAGKSALIISPTHAEGERLTHALRQRMRDTGKIDVTDVTLPRLVNYAATNAEKTDWRNYAVGQAIGFIQNLPGIGRGSVWDVSAVSEQGVSIKNIAWQIVSLPLDKASQFQVYHRLEIALTKGDHIRITQNGFDLDNNRLNNGQILQIVKAEENQPIELQSLTGKVYRLAPDYGYIAHAYCITSHAAQGKTVDHVFILQPEATFPATNSEQFYVSVSRGREGVTIYTNDKAALLEHALQSGHRQAAIELIQDNFAPLANVFENNAVLCIP